MSLTSYANLKTEITTWLDRADLSTAADTFIDLAESRIYRELKIRQMETALNITISSGVAAIPTGYMELRYAYVDTDPAVQLSMQTPEWVIEKYPTRSSDGKPKYMARDGTNFIFGPYPDSGYTIKGSFFKKLAPLSGSNTSNWLTNDAPELILFGALVESAPFIGDDERYPLWEQRYQQAKRNVEREYGFERHPLGMSVSASVG